MPLSDFTDERTADIAQFHSRMVEIAIVRGDPAMAHRAVDRAFEMLSEPRMVVSLNTPLEDLIRPKAGHPIAGVLARLGILTVGQLCGTLEILCWRCAG